MFLLQLVQALKYENVQENESKLSLLTDSMRNVDMSEAPTSVSPMEQSLGSFHVCDFISEHLWEIEITSVNIIFFRKKFIFTEVISISHMFSANQRPQINFFYLYDLKKQENLRNSLALLGVTQL